MKVVPFTKYAMLTLKLVFFSLINDDTVFRLQFS